MKDTNPMTKLQMIEELAALCGETTSRTENIFNAFIKLIYSELRAGRTVTISGFGKFSVSHRKARLGIHPRTLKPLEIPEYDTPKFVAGQAFKDTLRGHR